LVLRFTQTRPLDFAEAMSLAFAGVGAAALGAGALAAGIAAAEPLE